MPTYRLIVTLTFTNVDNTAARDQCIRCGDDIVAHAKVMSSCIRGGEKRLTLCAQRIAEGKAPRQLWAVEESVNVESQADSEVSTAITSGGCPTGPPNIPRFVDGAIDKDYGKIVVTSYPETGCCDE